MNKGKEGFVRLVVAMAEEVSSTPEKAKEYLESEGIDTDEFIERHLAKIKKLTEKYKSKRNTDSHE